MDRRTQAITYINNNKNKLDLNKIVEYIATNFNYSEKYARYIYFNNQKESNNKSLRETLDEIEERDQKNYLIRQKRKLQSNGKIIIDDSRYWG